MACVPSVALRLMPAILASFKVEHPMVNVTLKEVSRHQIIHSLRSGDVELGVANVPGEDPDLDAKLLLTDSFALVMRRDHPLAWRKTVSWETAPPLDFWRCRLAQASGWKWTARFQTRDEAGRCTKQSIPLLCSPWSKQASE